MCDEYELIVKCLVGILLQAFSIDSSKSVQVKGLTIQNSQQMNFVISRCDSVRITGVKVSSPEDSPNTDGIHITQSTNVILQESKIETGSWIMSISFTSVLFNQRTDTIWVSSWFCIWFSGDDCVSIVNASSNIKMKRIYCGPGHGIRYHRL